MQVVAAEALDLIRPRAIRANAANFFYQQKLKDALEGGTVDMVQEAAHTHNLVLYQYGGTQTIGDVHPLPPSAATELLSLVERNMRGFSGRDSSSGMMPSRRTRYLVLRCPGSPS